MKAQLSTYSFSAHGMCALVADDDDDARSLLSASLRRAGFDVGEARDGEELLTLFDVLRSQRADQPCVVVSDIGMPGRDGLDATRVLRQRSPNVPVVLVTAFSDPFTLRSARDAGAAVLLLKPIDGNALIQAVVGLTTRRGA